MNKESIQKHMTPAPWKANGYAVTKSNGWKIRQERPRAAAPEAWEHLNAQWQADALLIALAPSLLAENQEQAEEIKRLKNRIALFEEIRRLSTIEPKEDKI